MSGVQSLLVGALMVMGVLGAVALAADRQGGRQGECTRFPPAAVRDSDALVLVENLARADVVLRQGGSVQLFAVQSHGPSATFFFIRKGEPRPWALLIYDDRPVPASLTEIRGLTVDPATNPLASLADLALGPLRAMELVNAAYPAFSASTVTLYRDDYCRAVWKVAGTIDEEGKTSLLLKAYVYSDGKIRLLDGPPLPYEGLMELFELSFRH